MKNSKHKRNSSWDNVSSWYDSYLKSDNTLQAQVIAPNLMRVMNIQKGDSILDIACGQGYFSKIFQNAGATVVGVDNSKSLITKAKENSKDIKYLVHKSDSIGGVSDLSKDRVVIVLALENIENVLGTLSEAHRILLDSGTLYIVFMHPCFRIPKDSDWGYDENKKVQFRKTELYLSEKSYAIDMHPGDNKNKDTTISYHRPLQWYFKMFKKSGFSVVGLEEWISHKESGEGPKKKAEDTARKEFPMFLCISLKKL